METKKINKVKVRPLKDPEIKDDERPGRDSELFEDPYNTVFLSAKRNSGKSVVIGNILKRCCSKDTNVIIFCGTINSCATWKSTIHMLEKRGIPVEMFTSIYDDDGNDRLEMYYKAFLEQAGRLKERAKKREEEELMKEFEIKETDNLIADEVPQGEDEKSELDEMDEIEEERLKRLEKSKFKELRFVFVFDDLGDETRSNSTINQLLKTSRHLKSRVIISSQYIKDLLPSSVRNITHFLLFRNQGDETVLNKIIKEGSLNIEYDDLKKIFDHATKEPYNFLYIDTQKQKFRKNFDQEYQTPKNPKERKK